MEFVTRMAASSVGRCKDYRYLHNLDYARLTTSMAELVVAASNSYKNNVLDNILLP